MGPKRPAMVNEASESSGAAVTWLKQWLVTLSSQDIWFRQAGFPWRFM
jgi:hypothetical protein